MNYGPYTVTLLIAVVLSKVFFQPFTRIECSHNRHLFKPSYLPILFSVISNSVSLGLHIYHFKAGVLKQAVFSGGKGKLTCVRTCRFLIRAYVLCLKN